MEENEKDYLRGLLRQLCSIQDNITHMNEACIHDQDDFDELIGDRTRKMHQIIKYVDTLVSQQAA